MSLENQLQASIAANQQLHQTVSAQAGDWENRMVAKEQQMNNFINSAPNSMMSRTFHVNQQTGDDNNSGTSASSAFASIGKAIASTPVHGSVHIVLAGLYVSTSSLSITNKKVSILIGDNASIEHTQASNGSVTMFRLNGEASLNILFNQSSASSVPKIRVVQNANLPSLSSTKEGFVLVEDGSQGNGVKNISFVGAGLEVPNIVLADLGVGKLVGTINWLGSGASSINIILGNRYGAGAGSAKFIKRTNVDFIDFNASCGSLRSATLLEDGSGAVLDVASQIGGLVKDANGVCLNVNSNMVL